MNKKLVYEAPKTELSVIIIEDNFLISGNASVETLTDIEGSWDD